MDGGWIWGMTLLKKYIIFYNRFRDLERLEACCCLECFFKNASTLFVVGNIGDK